MIKKLWITFVIFWGVVLLFFMAMSLGLFGFMPSFDQLENTENNLATEIISCNNVILGTFSFENRSNVSYNDVSPNLVNALIATEDVRFYKHSGIDFRALLRVGLKTVVGRNRSSGGGSTITQQLAKNLFPREDLGKIGIIFRKFKEWIIAVKLEYSYTKEEILTMYLNTNEYGSNAFGIRIASMTFFGKEPKDINKEEAAVLVGLLKAPTYYSPVRNYDNSVKRRNVVLAQMEKAGYLTESERDSLQNLKIDTSKYAPQSHTAGTATYFREYVRKVMNKFCKEYRKSDGTYYNLYTDGLKIYTTIDSRMQKYAEEAVAEHLGKDLQPQFFKSMKGLANAPFNDITQKDIQAILMSAMRQSDRYRSMKKEGFSEEEILKVFKEKVKMRIFTWAGGRDTVMSPWDSLIYHKWFLHSGLMSIEPQTGNVKAYVGGINYQYFQFDNVTQGKRQVGSTFKPFVYSVALETGRYNPCTQVANVETCFEGIQPDGSDWCPKNSDNKRKDQMVSLKWALANSVNFVSAFLMKDVGPARVVKQTHRMGIQSEIPEVPAICLGSCDLSVYEMTAAFSTFVNEGVYSEPIMITRIEDRYGNIIENFTSQKTEAINKTTAYMMIKLMQGVVEGGTGSRIRHRYNIPGAVAGKTGTSQNQSDGWFMGSIPALTTGVWVGGELRSIHFRAISQGQGAAMALPIWALYHQKIYADKTLDYLEKADEFKHDESIHVNFDCSAADDPEEIKAAGNNDEEI
ncbi:MAG: transglycosylase domain-containing protein [Bacteroidales bacterium]|jgi:penicillin-binding protein 1A|nr:transglycosylase domain-containing protein [Bacteroidales bacterium]